MNIQQEQLAVALPAWRTSDLTVALLSHLNTRRRTITAATVDARLTASREQIADNLSRIAAFSEVITAIEAGAFLATTTSK